MVDVLKERNMELNERNKTDTNKYIKRSKHNNNIDGFVEMNGQNIENEKTEIEKENKIRNYENKGEELQKRKYPKEIQLTFTTELTDEIYQIDNNIYTIPVSFERIDLSRIVKKLLNLEDADIVFEFLINKKILRTSIEQFLEEHNILSEQVLEVEFTKPLLKKESKKVSNITEWISDLIIVKDILYGSTFEGNLIHYNLHNFNTKGNTKIAEFPIHSFNCCQKKNMGLIGNIQESVFGLSNGTLQVILHETSKKGLVIKSKVFLSNHDNTIRSLSFSRNKSLLISGGADKRVNIYNNKKIVEELKRIEEEEENNGNKDENEEAKSGMKNKKRKNADRNKREEKINIKIDPQKSIYLEDYISVSGLDFFDNTHFLCTGLGNFINIFDVSNGNMVSSISHNKYILRSSIIKEDLFVTADEHSYINLFDKRCLNEQAVISLNPNHYFFHDKIITSLKSHKSELYFLTSSHDGYINVYDIRMNNCPVYAIENEDSCKVLAATWFYEKENSKAIINADEVSLKMHLF